MLTIQSIPVNTSGRQRLYFGPFSKGDLLRRLYVHMSGTFDVNVRVFIANSFGGDLSIPMCGGQTDYFVIERGNDAVSSTTFGCPFFFPKSGLYFCVEFPSFYFLDSCAVSIDYSPNFSSQPVASKNKSSNVPV